MNLEIHFWLKSEKVKELESQKARESQGTLLKKLGRNPEGVSQNFAEFTVVKSCFLRVNMENLKNHGRFFTESIYILKPLCLEFLSYSPYPAKEAGSALNVLTRLSRSGLPSLI